MTMNTTPTDLGPCSTKPSGCKGRLVGITSDDGKALECEGCPVCGCFWTYNPAPRPAIEGMITMAEFRVMRGAA